MSQDDILMCIAVAITVLSVWWILRIFKSAHDAERAAIRRRRRPF